MHDDLLFRRGYLIVEDSLDTTPLPEVSDWITQELNTHTIYTHPDLHKNILRSEKYNIAVLGTVIDPISEINDPNTILKLINSHLSSSKDAFFDYIDNLSGRFVLFVEGGRQSFALQDAAGTKSLYYDKMTEDTILGSNPGLIAGLDNYKQSAISKEVIDSDASYFPGISTPYEDIKQLTPNTLIRLPGSDIERFYPRQSLTPRNLDNQLVEEASNILINHMELMNENHDLVLSLSAGLDSRVSLAATKSISDDIKYCSWTSPSRDYREVEIAKEVCKRIGVDHHVIDLSDSPPRKFTEIFEKHTSNMSDPDRAGGTYNFYNKQSDNILELRSNVAEIGQTFYRDDIMWLPKTLHPETFSKLYFRTNSQAIDKEFRIFFETTSFTWENIYNYDPYDLFYWEHRMGNWLSQWMTDRDLSHDHFVVYNNRRLIEQMLSVDINHRLNNRLFYAIIDNIWPECLEVPINPHKNKPYTYSLQRAAKGILIRIPSPIYNRIINKYIQ